MKVVFRVDASIKIGIGHVMRCLTLAEFLCEQGANCCFICREHPGNLIDLISQRGFDVLGLPKLHHQEDISVQKNIVDEHVLMHETWLGGDWRIDAEQTKDAVGDESVDWLIVDHYGLDIRWESALEPCFEKLMIIDDLADRQHSCDLLLDQNLGRTQSQYLGLVPIHCNILVGPSYALLRPEFAELRQYSLSRRNKPQLKHLLITMGGVDKDNATGQALATLGQCDLPMDLHITVVMGEYAPWLMQVRNQSERMPWPTEVLVNVNNMAKLMADSDFSIGAAGSTSWERCCMGLPAMLVILANNQLGVAKALVKSGCSLLLGRKGAIAINLPLALKHIQDGDRLIKMQDSSAILTAGEGVKLIADVLTNVYDQPG